MQGFRPSKRFWGAYSALYGEQIEIGEDGRGDGTVVAPRPKKKAVRACPLEQEEQFVVVAWLKRMGIAHHHSPNGGHRDYREAAKFKRLGVSAGFPDLVVPYARKGRHGLYIELKRLYGGSLSEHQKWWRDFLLAEGNAWHEAKGAADCIRIVCDYLDINLKGNENERI